ncbi:uncharacterized protein SRS1_11207 [Sporisorium reilianum f. sp. reilianum]|uniref:Uncharacterized protein n=1 Tax=Sporisorium reilianum f. sp. reilianum TaxID=72559 RepID=A0A2N8UG77_9BASI|nr:uncharacterized protein SRS1_11207 [Sporisorium reilianum f. sp. reilianum]
MRLTHSSFCGIVLAAVCCLCHVSAVPSFFRRQASKAQVPSSSQSELELLHLDPTEQLAIFGDADHAREMYKAATREKIALIRLWRQKAEETSELSNAERLERQEWLHNLSSLKDQMQDDLQGLLSTFRSFQSTQAQNEKGVTNAVSLKQAAAMMVEEYKGAFQQYVEELSSQLRHAVEQYDGHMQHAIQQHLSKAVDLVETGLAAPLQAMISVAVDLESHTDALQLVLQGQHGLVSELSAASAEMVSLQRTHEEQLADELEGLREIQTGFQGIERGMNATQRSLDALLQSQRLSTSFSLLSGAVFAVERVLFWSIGEFEHRLGLDVGNVTAWRCVRWLLFFWPDTIKLKAFIVYSFAILKGLLAAVVLLSMLLNSVLQPFYSLLWSLYLHIRQGAGGRPTKPKAPAASTDDATDTKVKLEPTMSDSWCVVPGAFSRAQIASRCSTPHEARSLSTPHGSRPVRRSRIHCPSAI